jgi:hypothetical protein
MADADRGLTADYPVLWEDSIGPCRARWTFYDSYVAFPSSVSERRGREKNVFAEVMLGLDGEGGGTLGEWRVSWYRFGSDFRGRLEDRGSPRIEAFHDSWQALHASGVVEMLAEWERSSGKDEWLTPDEFMDMLRERGWLDRTAQLHGPHADICPTCFSHDFEGDREVLAWRERIKAAEVTDA